jgi:hypothetical protein
MIVICHMVRRVGLCAGLNSGISGFKSNIYTFIHQNGSNNKRRERKTKVKTKLLLGAAMDKALCYNGNTTRK